MLTGWEVLGLYVVGFVMAYRAQVELCSGFDLGCVTARPRWMLNHLVLSLHLW